LTRVVLAMPDRWEWWNEKTREREPGPGYPRYSLHGAAAYLMLGERARADGDRGPGSAMATLLVNRADAEIDVDAAIVALGRIVARERLRLIEIPKSDSLSHDLVSVDGDNAPRIRAAYAWLARAMGVTLPDPLARQP